MVFNIHTLFYIAETRTRWAQYVCIVGIVLLLSGLVGCLIDDDTDYFSLTCFFLIIIGIILITKALKRLLGN